MNLNDLKQSVSDMNEQELEAHLLAIRQSRRTRKTPVVVVSTGTEVKAQQSAEKKQAKMLELFNAMTPREKEIFIQEMKG